MTIYCGVIKKELAVSVCPLPAKRCMWQKGVQCCFTDEELTVEQFCKLMDLPVPSKEELDAVTVNIKVAINTTHSHSHALP